MIHSLIFGESVEPGSSDVCQAMLELQNRGDVKRFCKQLRVKIAGGVEAVRERRRQAIELERAGRDAEAQGRFDEALSNLTNAVELLGDFTPNLLSLVTRILVELNRLEEAVALSFYGINKFPNEPVIVVTLNAAHAKLGYQDRSRFTEQDLERTIARFLAIEGENWTKNLYPLVHLWLHGTKRSQETIAMVQKKGDLLRKIGNNQTLLALFRKHFSDLSAQELRFLFTFFLWIENFWMKMVHDCDYGGAISKELMSFEWFKLLVGNYFSSVLSDQGLIKLAKWDALKPEVVFRPFISALIPVGSLYMDSTSRKMIKPVDDFEWFCRLAIAPIICGVKFEQDNYVVHACSAMFSLLTKLFGNEHFKRNVRSMSRESCHRSLDFLLLLGTVNFVEFKFDLVAVDSLAQRENIRSITPYELWDSLQNVFGPIFLPEWGDVFREDYLVGHSPFFVFWARRFAFLTSNLSKLTSKGKNELWGIFSLLALLFHRHLKSPKLANNLADCQEFCDFFLVALAKFSAIDDKVMLDKRALSYAVEFVGKMAAFSPRSYCSYLLRSQRGDCLLEFVLQPRHFQPKGNSFFCLAALLTNGTTFETRLRLLNKFPGLMERLGAFVFERFFKYLNKTKADDFDYHEFCNVQLCFLELLPDYFDLDDDDDSKQYGEMAQFCASKMLLFADVCEKLVEKGQSDVIARYLQISALLDGIILSKLLAEDEDATWEHVRNYLRKHPRRSGDDVTGNETQVQDAKALLVSTMRRMIEIDIE